jgi:hypothetical protein
MEQLENAVYANPAKALQSTLYWDFFGPNAAQTAAHFQKHLSQFLLGNAIAARLIELKSEQEFHMAVVCQIDDPSAARAVANTLRAAGRSTLAESRVETTEAQHQPG